VTNTGERAGAEVTQLYLTAPRTRLLAFERVELEPGEARRVTLTAEPRLLARFRDGRWTIADGDHDVAVATAADAPVLSGGVTLGSRHL